MKTNDSAVAFIDLIGFSNLINFDFEMGKDVLNDFYNIVYENKEYAAENEIKTILVSDSLIAYTNNRVKLIPYLAKIYRTCLDKTNSYENQNKYILPRGGVSFGNVYTEERLEDSNLRKNFIVSPALVRTSFIEKAVKGSRLIVAIENSSTDKSDIYWNRDSESIFYKENTFIDSNFTYYDILWFEDLRLPEPEKKNSIEKNLKIAIHLLELNKNLEEKYLVQYIEIVRIGLISYVKHLTSRFEFPEIIKSLFSDYFEEKFWKLWVSLLESIFLVNDSKWAPPNKEFLQFYNTIVISKGWNTAIEYLHEPNQKEILDKLIKYKSLISHSG